MQLWECKVKVNGVPQVMTTRANNMVTAKGFFQNFGPLLNEPRMING